MAGSAVALAARHDASSRMPATTTAPSRDLTQRVDVETPELVVLSYTIAGVGSRVYAGLIDLVVCMGLFLATILALAVISARFGVHIAPDAVGAWAGAFILLAQFVVFWGYYVLCEGFADGQTFGKWRLGLRVVRDGGYSVGFAASATRNIMRAIDMQPLVSYLFGISAITISKSGKRLGDLVAGTIVVQERLVESPLAKRSKRSPTPAAAAVAKLSEEEFRLLERWYARRQDIEPERRKQLTSQIAGRLSGALGDEDGPEAAKLIRLYESERHARDAGAASRQETGAARERYAIISTGSPRWLAFAAVVTEAQRRGLKSLGEARVREFVSEYRMLSSDLARLQTATRQAASDELFYLSRLVGAAHNLLYKDRRSTLNDVFRFVLSDVPAEIRRSWRPIALAVVALFLPLTIAMTAVIQHPEVAPAFIPVTMLDRAQDGIKRAQAGTGYVEDPQILRPVLASSIIANNVQVTFFTFAGGITAGGLTMLLLLLNGVSIGGILGLYQSKGILPLLLAFVAPHGVLELSAICIAGGAGFLVAAALLIPGRRTRRRALAENGRRAITLVCGSSLLLVIAGSLEGLVSPIPYWPLELKLIVSALTTLFLILYVRGGPRQEAAATRNTVIDPELLGLGSVTGNGV
jgi:uncharacterized membrane protein SpoIIM required for sporulation/uncharacterized RDD family membrane protein YckC